MAIDQAANDLLDQVGSGPPSFFSGESSIGDTAKGKIVSVTKRQQTKYKTNEPLYWDDAKTQPKWQVAIVCEPLDGGEQFSLYAKGQMLTVIKEAIVAAGADGFEEGATIAVKFDSTKPSDKGNDQKLYTAAYKPPVESAVKVDDLGLD